MSNVSKLKKLMSVTDELYDRFVNLTFTNSISGYKLNINTPKSGPKPNISVQLRTLPSNMATQFTISIMNCSVGVDLSQFDTVTCSMGYYKSNAVYSFEGTILHAFQESPNPNGIVSFQGEMGNTVALANSMPITLTFDYGSKAVTSYIKMVIDAINDAIPSTGKKNSFTYDQTFLPAEWKTAMIDTYKTTEQFTSAYEALSWLNGVLLSYAYSKYNKGKFPVIYMYIDKRTDGDYIRVASNTAAPEVPTLTSLSTVNSIAVEGIHVTINCPFVPSIKGNTCFCLSASAYTSRFNVCGISSLKPTNIIKANYTEVKFSTNGTNMMHIDGIILDNALAPINLVPKEDK